MTEKWNSLFSSNAVQNLSQHTRGSHGKICVATVRIKNFSLRPYNQTLLSSVNTLKERKKEECPLIFFSVPLSKSSYFTEIYQRPFISCKYSICIWGIETSPVCGLKIRRAIVTHFSVLQSHTGRNGVHWTSRSNMVPNIFGVTQKVSSE